MGKKASINAATLFRIRSTQSNEFEHESYVLVKSEAARLQDLNYSYKLYFYSGEPDDAPWYGLFEPLGLDIAEIGIPQVQHSAFILIVKLKSHVYAITGGSGHLHLKSCYDVEPEFGIEVAERVMNDGDISGLAQKTTSGPTLATDRHFRGKYKPKEDTKNFKSILKSVRGHLPIGSKNYLKIGKGIVAGDGFRVTGAKSFLNLIEFIFEIDAVMLSSSKSLEIPRPAYVNPTKDPSHMSALQKAMAASLSKNVGEDRALFLDMQALPLDEVTEYILLSGRTKAFSDTETELFAEVRKTLRASSSSDRLATLEKMKFRIRLESGAEQEYRLVDYLCGDVFLNGDAYFISERNWYQADGKYLDLLDSELRQVLCLDPKALKLKTWDVSLHQGREGEEKYNGDHASTHLVLDRRLVLITGKAGVELCDLLFRDSVGTYMLHVKSARGAQLRGLFAQGAVSAQMYAHETDFRTMVHSGNLKKIKPDLTSAEKASLASLANKKRAELTIVYAIFDAKEPRVAFSTAKNALDIFGGILTPFAKADLLERVSTIRDLGYRIGLVRIG